jgi:ATP-dependent helicase/nuclease subunit B
VSVVLVPPRFGLIRAVADRLSSGPKDLSRTWIVFPEKRPGYHLRKALAAREGTGFVPPRIDSFDGFVGRVFEERLKKVLPLLDPLDAVKVLFDIHVSGASPLSGRAFLSPDGFFSLGLKMYRDLESLTEAGVSAEALRGLDVVAEEGREKRIPPRSRGRLQSLSFFHERFYAAVAELGASTPASRLAEVAARMGPELFEPGEELMFAGFYVLSEMERRLLRASAGRPETTLLFLEGKGIEAALSSLGIDPASASRPSGEPGPEAVLTFTKSPDTHGQVFALNGWLAGAVATPGALDDRTVIVLPAAESLFPVYHQTLAMLPEDAFNISIGYPLARTPLFTFFEQLFEVLRTRDDDGRIFGPRYLRFVLHPYTKNIFYRAPGGNRPDVTRVLFHAVEEHFTRKRMKAFWTVEELETDPGLWKTVQDLSAALEDPPLPIALREHLRDIHARTFGRFIGIRDTADFARKSGEVLEDIYRSSTARLHPLFHPFAEAFRRRFEALAGSRFGAVVFEDPGSYFSLFRKVVAEGIVPFTGTPLRGLQVLGFWETRGIPFEEVALLDANEGVLPSFKKSDTLLPFAVRRALGLPTSDDLERRMAYHLDTLVRGAKRVRIFYIENKDRERSRFVESLVWERQKALGEKDAARFVRALQYRVDLRAGDPAPVPKSPEVAAFLGDFRHSASSLNMYLACPLKFYQAYVLGLREKETLDETMDTKDIGTLVHAALEEYYRPFVGRDLSAADLRPTDMEAVVERLFRERYGTEQRGSAFLLKTQVVRHLREFLSDYQAPVIEAAPGGTIRVLELEAPRPLDFEIGGAVYKAVIKADRTERRGAATYVLDYKTGSSPRFHEISFKKLAEVSPESLLESPREACGTAVRSVQIAFYSLAYAQLLGAAPESVHGKIVLLGTNGLGPESEFSPLDEKSGKGDLPRAEKLETMRRVIAGLLREIGDPDRPFVPAEDAAACLECPFAVTCDRKM